jgi:hypothetical protein
MNIYQLTRPYWSWNEGTNNSSKKKSKREQSWVETPDLLLSDSEDSFCLDDLCHQPLHHYVAGEVRQVRFKAARVREYAVVIGDHPVCRDPLPLTLDWRHAEEVVYDINAYEDMRHHSRRRRGKRGKLRKLSFLKRRKILERVGPLSTPESFEAELEMSKESRFDPERFRSTEESVEVELETSEVPYFDPFGIRQDIQETESLFEDFDFENHRFEIPSMKVQILED